MRIMPKKIKKWFLWGLLCITIGTAAALTSFAFIIKDLPNPEEFENRKISQSTKIYDRTGQVLLYEIHGEEKRTVIPYEEIPLHAKQATLALEDKNFYNQPAFNWRGILRALFKNVVQGELSQGGSTITQQLAKNAFLSREKTITRKIKELLVALELEKRYSKDQILSLYLNQIPYGGNAYGIEAASQAFFNKGAKNLSIAESATLAALLQAPSYYSPWGSHLDKLLSRKDFTIEQMQKAGYINEDQKKAAQKEELKFTPKATGGIKAPHFVLAVQDYLVKKYGEDFVRSSGLNVVTTLDWNLQQIAEKAVLEGAEKNTKLYQGHNAALVAQDATNGQVIALVGSKDYFADEEPADCVPGKSCKFEGNFNVATLGLRQPGSAMKPFAYITAFERGYSPDTVLFDLPTEFAANNQNCPAIVDFTNENKECFHPQNFDHAFRCPISMRNTLAQSINTTTVKTLYLAGIDNTLKTARDFGITPLTERSRYGLSLVLGGGEVTLADLVGAYSVFAQDGVKHQQTFILKITTSHNDVLENFKDTPAQVIDPHYTQLLNSVLSDVQARTPLFSSSLNLTTFPGHDVAMKTGTTNDYRDAWTVGYSPDLAVGVWAGNNDNTVMHKQAGSILAALPIWNTFMKAALANKPPTPFNNPEPTIAEKAVLRGEYITNFSYENSNYPQIHTILYYLDKDNPNGPRPEAADSDPQFKNWEDPIIKWGQETIPNFQTIFNQPLPQQASETTSLNYHSSINFITPHNGDFIKSQTIPLEAAIISDTDITKIQLLLNGQPIAEEQRNFGTSFSYKTSIQFKDGNQQNSITLKAESNGSAFEKSIIVFR